MSVAEKFYKKSTKKLAAVSKRIQLIGKINNIRNVHRKLKLKVVKEQKKSKKNTNKRKAVQTTDAVLKNIVTGSSENGLDNVQSQLKCTGQSNNTSNGVNEVMVKCDGNRNIRNPVKDGQQLFEWLLHPLNIIDFIQ